MARKNHDRVTFYQVYYFPGDVGVDEEYIIQNDPEGLADDPAPSFPSRREAEEFRRHLADGFPGERLRVVKTTHKILG